MNNVCGLQILDVFGVDIIIMMRYNEFIVHEINELPSYIEEGKGI